MRMVSLLIKKNYIIYISNPITYIIISNMLFFPGWVTIYFVLFKIFQRVGQYCYTNEKLDFKSFCRHIFDFNKLTGIIIVVAIIIIALLTSNIKDGYIFVSVFGVVSLLEFANYVS